jgi:hypothetical protein
MGYERKELSGALFPNDRKGNDRAPTWRGYVIINQVEYELAGWDKTSQRGHFLSISAKVKEERRDGKSISQQAQAKVRRPDPISTGRPRNDDLDDSIPFAPEFR